MFLFMCLFDNVTFSCANSIHSHQDLLIIGLQRNQAVTSGFPDFHFHNIPEEIAGHQALCTAFCWDRNTDSAKRKGEGYSFTYITTSAQIPETKTLLF